MNEPAKFITELVGRILTLDPANLIIVGTIAFGYALHFCEFPIRLRGVNKFPREYIPLATALFTIILYPIIAWKDGQPFRKLVVDAILAMILWAIAWGVHKFVLLPLRAKLMKKVEEGKTPGPPPPSGPTPSPPGAPPSGL